MSVDKNKIFDLVIVGAGTVGLATAYNYLVENKDKKVLILEKEDEVSCHQSGRNSGVIHSGIYYKPGSYKAKNCIDGYKRLVHFCSSHEIRHEICGKIIVAKDKKEIPILDEIYMRGKQNGLDGLKFLDQEAIQLREPNCIGIKGILVPQTGIINYKELSQKLLETYQNLGGAFQNNTQVTSIREHYNQIEVVSNELTYLGKKVVICAGIHSDLFIKNKKQLKLLPFRGEYYKIARHEEKIINHLIYPVPNPEFPFLGVHFTRMIDGSIECGPNAVLAFGKEAYSKFDFNLSDIADFISWKGFHRLGLKYWRIGLQEMYRSFSKNAFVDALAELVPKIRDVSLETVPAGIRAQACNDSGILLDDFYFEKNGNLLVVANAPSPAATSCLSIGASICRELNN